MAGLYIHIPFCLRKCAYCDFVSSADFSRMPEYLVALHMELRQRADFDRRIDTVFIGGGTPSVLPHGAVSRLMSQARRHFDIAEDAEITIECNPGTVDEPKLNEYLACGINRISIGAQSLNDGLLKRIGRAHDSERFFLAYRMARSSGFANINVDIMYGLPGQTLRQHVDTMRAIVEMRPEHISAYSLILEEGTPLCDAICNGDVSPLDDDTVYELHRETVRCLLQAGYKRYEISNYSKQGYECRHNLNYWDNGEYIGAGLNAHSALRQAGRIVRSSNTQNIDEYIAHAKRKRLIPSDRSVISRSEEMFETVMLGLRRTDGLSESGFFERFGVTVQDAYPEALKALAALGWLVRSAGRIYLNETGLDMQNEALLYFMD